MGRGPPLCLCTSDNEVHRALVLPRHAHVLWCTPAVDCRTGDEGMAHTREMPGDHQCAADPINSAFPEQSGLVGQEEACRLPGCPGAGTAVADR